MSNPQTKRQSDTAQKYTTSLISQLTKTPEFIPSTKEWPAIVMPRHGKASQQMLGQDQNGVWYDNRLATRLNDVCLGSSNSMWGM